MSGGTPSTSATSQRRKQLRWRREQLHQFIVNETFIDLHRSRARALYVASWQRSGSTWLAEIVASMPGTRLLFEPANIRQHLTTYGAQPRLNLLPLSGPGSQLGKDGDMLSKALDGSLRALWMDQMNTTRVATRRVVKDIRTVAILPWLVDSFPEVPMVLLLRHPVAVAHSIIELGWVGGPRYKAAVGLQSPDPAGDEAAPEPAVIDRAARQRMLIYEVSLWSAHHGWAMAHPASARLHVMFYEDLVQEPTAELDRLHRYLADYDPVWSEWLPQLESLRQPSSTSFRRKEAGAGGWIDSWAGAYDADTLDEVQRILESEHLEGLYGASPVPLIAGDAAIDSVRGSLGRPAAS